MPQTGSVQRECLGKGKGATVDRRTDLCRLLEGCTAKGSGNFPPGKCRLVRWEAKQPAFLSQFKTYIRWSGEGPGPEGRCQGRSRKLKGT